MFDQRTPFLLIMEEQTFTLAEAAEYIPLDKLLKLVGAVGSGGEAHRSIEEGLVMVNGTQEWQKRKKIRTGDVVDIGGVRVVVARKAGSGEAED